MRAQRNSSVSRTHHYLTEFVEDSLPVSLDQKNSILKMSQCPFLAFSGRIHIVSDITKRCVLPEEHELVHNVFLQVCNLHEQGLITYNESELTNVCKHLSSCLPM